MFAACKFVREHMWLKAIRMAHPMRLELTRVGLLVECFFSAFASVYIEVPVLC